VEEKMLGWGMLWSPKIFKLVFLDYDWYSIPS